MLQEYSTIAQSFFSLYAQLNETLRTYLALITAGVAASTFLLQILPKLYVVPASFDDLRLLGVLFVFLGVLGVTACISLIGLRCEMLLYARTINGVRRYFYARNPAIRPFIVLPISSFKPHFNEGPISPYFWQIVLMGIVNSTIGAGGTFLALSLPTTAFWVTATFLAAGLLIGAHVWLYRILATRIEQSFPTHFGLHPLPGEKSDCPVGCEFDSRGPH